MTHDSRRKGGPGTNQYGVKPGGKGPTQPTAGRVASFGTPAAGVNLPAGHEWIQAGAGETAMPVADRLAELGWIDPQFVRVTGRAWNDRDGSHVPTVTFVARDPDLDVQAALRAAAVDLARADGADVDMWLDTYGSVNQIVGETPDRHEPILVKHGILPVRVLTPPDPFAEHPTVGYDDDIASYVAEGECIACGHDPCLGPGRCTWFENDDGTPRTG